MGKGTTRITALSLAKAVENPNEKLRELVERMERESPEAQAKQLAEGRLCLARMKAHTNYKIPEPDYREDSLEFTCRAIGELISPPQLADESEELECVDIKLALLAYGYELRAIWQVWVMSRGNIVERFDTKRSIPPDNGTGSSELVAAWKLDEMPETVWYDHAGDEWKGRGGKIWKRSYFDRWSFLPKYQ